MNQELKNSIIKYVQENKHAFQIVNQTKDTFRKWIYTDKGEYEIGGEKVAQFINDFIKIYTNE